MPEEKIILINNATPNTNNAINIQEVMEAHRQSTESRLASLAQLKQNNPSPQSEQQNSFEILQETLQSTTTTTSSNNSVLDGVSEKETYYEDLQLNPTGGESLNTIRENNEVLNHIRSEAEAQMESLNSSILTTQTQQSALQEQLSSTLNRLDDHVADARWGHSVGNPFTIATDHPYITGGLIALGAVIGGYAVLKGATEPPQSVTEQLAGSVSEALNSEIFVPTPAPSPGGSLHIRPRPGKLGEIIAAGATIKTVVEWTIRTFPSKPGGRKIR